MTANAQTAAEPTAGKYYHIKVGDLYIDNAIPTYNNKTYSDGFHLSGEENSAALFRLEAVGTSTTTFYLNYVGNGMRPSGRVLYTGNNGAGTVVLGKPTVTQNGTWDIAAKGSGYTIISGGTDKGGFNNWEGNKSFLALWSNTGSATECTFEEVTVTDLLSSVTYSYAAVEGTQFSSYTVDQLRNTTSCAWSPHALLSTLTYNKETLAAATEAVTVTCNAVYPFEPTTIADGKLADGTKWYTMNVNQGADKAVYTGENDAVKANGTRVFDANHLWCFVRVAGTFDQFHIYNLEKGVNAPLTLVKNAIYNEYNQATASTGTGGTETTQFRLVPNGEGYCLQHPDQSQANIGDHGTGGGEFMVWQGVGSSTHDKSRIFFQSADDLIDVAQKIKESEFVGGYTNVPAQLTEKINTYKAAKNVENLKNLAVENRAAVAGGMERRMLSTDKYYELLTYKRVKGARLYLNPSTTAGMVEADLDAKASKDCSELSSLWQFVPTTDGRYKVTHANTGKSLGTGRSSANQTLMNVPADEANAGTYVLVDHNTECDVWGIQCNNNNYLNMNNYNGDVVYMYWSGPSTDDGSPWQLREVSEVEVALNAVDGEGSLATLHLPFNAMVKEGGTTVNVGALNDDKSKLMLSPVSGVPANTGVVLHNADAAASVTLTIGGDVEAAASALSGTNVSIALTDENRADYLIFSLVNGELGFYGISDALTQLAANKAYLLAAGLNPSGVRLMLGGDPTGIGNAVVTGLEDKAPLYDLSGRRVKEAAKGGIYLRNGKKFIVK